ncbi:MAG: MbnP family copper-binding protein [Cyanobacteria bacterium P01_G01_bin.19]
MFLSVNQKSILLATAIALGSAGFAQAQSNTQEVAIEFEGWVGEDRFVCGESYDRVGRAETTITPTDFRFYVSDVALIDEDGNPVPVELEQDGKWQHQSTALLDFEDGSNACDNGTTETNTAIVGTVPEGDYQGLQFTLGVPQNLNHEDAAIAPSPLNLTSMWWNWQGGYKFLRAEMETDSAIANAVSQPSHSHGGNHSTTKPSSQTGLFKNEPSDRPQAGNAQMEHGGMNHDMSHGNGDKTNASSNSYLIHLGSTGCKESARSPLFGCANPNRATVTLSDFNPDDNVVIADLAELLFETDLGTNQANTPTGCMSSPEDSDCSGIIQRLGLSFNGMTAPEGQQFFFVE